MRIAGSVLIVLAIVGALLGWFLPIEGADPDNLLFMLKLAMIIAGLLLGIAGCVLFAAGSITAELRKQRRGG